MTPEQIQGWLQLGLGGIMLAALFLGYRKIWVWGWYATDLEHQRDEWKQMAIHGLEAAASVAQAATRHTTLTSEEAETALRVIREAGRDRSVAHDNR